MKSPPPKPYVIQVLKGFHRVRFDPLRLRAGAMIRVMRGRGMRNRLVPYQVLADYDPRLGRLSVVAANSTVIRDINPLDVWDITDEAS